jgi:predicted TIM-barrel fold metal-dependent hydrolase
MQFRVRRTAIVALAAIWSMMPGATSRAVAKEMRDGGAVLRAMRERYANDWYDTLTFQQDSITHEANGTDKAEVWYEALMVPGKLRIDIGKPDSGNGMLVADGTLTRFQNNEVTSSRPFVHMLLVLGFDVYRQPLETTIAQVKSEGFDVDKVHEDTWEGKPVYVVGADKGDSKSKQFWIEKESLLFVRLVEPDKKEPTKINDTRFGDYRKLPVGWVAARVDFYVDGKDEFSEVYSNIQANPKLAAAFFDAKQFKPLQDKPPAGKAQGIQYGEDPDAAKRMTLLLKDFHPTPMLHVPVHEVPRAKFYVIDVHNHVNDARGGDEGVIPPAEVVKRLDQVNVKRVVVLTGAWGEKLQQVLDRTVKLYPDRFMVFTQMDWSKINDANFSAEMVAQLDDAVKRGARGLKVLKDWGLGVRDSSGKLVPIDDPRMDPVWEECGRLGIPVAIHSTDPEAFFTPTDAKNERYEELMHNPSWSFYGADFPSKTALLDQRNHVIAKHPRTIFIALHVANWPENLDVVSEWLRKYPNMYVEFGAREAELGREPRRAAQFFNEFQDRIMFGTDAEPVPEMYANYFRWLETGDEYFPYWNYPEQGRWMIYGMKLPDSILEKVYHANAERVFAMYRDGAVR